MLTKQRVLEAKPPLKLLELIHVAILVSATGITGLNKQTFLCIGESMLSCYFNPQQ